MSQYRGLLGYTHIQTTPVAVWTVQHSIGTMYPIIDCFIEFNGELVKSIPTSIEATSSSVTTVTWSSPQSGKASIA